MKRIIICIGIMLCLCANNFAQVNDSTVYKTTLLVNADDMPVHHGQLIALPYQGLFIADGNTFYSLDEKECPEVEKFRLLENIPIEQVIVNDNEFIVKSQQFLMLLGEKDTEILAEFDTEDFTIFSGRDSIVNVVSYENADSCIWYRFDRRTGETECILQESEPIRKIVSGNQVDFCIIGNNVYYVKDDVCEELVVSEKPIKDIVLLPKGLMFCTDDMLSLISDDCVTPLLEGDFHGLHYDGKVVYIILKNGNIWWME
jgi:hypothetical protein